MWLLIRKEETTESFSLSLTSFKSPQDRRRENDKAGFEPSPPSETRSLLPASLSRFLSLLLCLYVCLTREIIGKHFLLKSLSVTLTSPINRKETSVYNLATDRFVVSKKKQCGQFGISFFPPHHRNFT